ncbi:MAG: hypothetical protein ABIQ75_03155 [Flavobacteriales bacterium]
MRPPGAGARQQRTVDVGPPEPQWPTTMMAVGVLLFIILFWTVGQLTLISYTGLFRWFALFAFAGNLLPKHWYAKRFEMDRFEWFWFNLLAVGPMTFCAALLLNFFVHGPEQKVLVQAGRNFDLHTYWQENRALPPHFSWPAEFGNDLEEDRIAIAIARPGDVVYGLAEGMFGYVVITSGKKVALGGGAK